MRKTTMIKRIFLLFTLSTISCGKKINIYSKTKGLEKSILKIEEILLKKGDILKEEIKSQLKELDKDEDKRNFMLQLLDRSFSKKLNIDREAILASIETDIKAFQITKEELNFGGHVLGKIISQKEDIEKAFTENLTNDHKNVRLKISLGVYKSEIGMHMEYLLRLIAQYIPHSDPQYFGFFLGNLGNFSSQVQDIVIAKISNLEYAQTMFFKFKLMDGENIFLERQIFSLFKSKVDFRFEYFNWLINEQNVKNHRNFKSHSFYIKDYLIHSSARYFDSEWFNYLVSKGHKMEFRDDAPKADPIHILIMEAARKGKEEEEEALVFLNDIKDNIDLVTLSKERGYLHFSSFFLLPKLVTFFLNYVDINEEYKILDKTCTPLQFMFATDTISDNLDMLSKKEDKDGETDAFEEFNTFFIEYKKRKFKSFNEMLQLLISRGAKIQFSFDPSKSPLAAFLMIAKTSPWHMMTFDIIINAINDVEDAKNFYLHLKQNVSEGNISKKFLHILTGRLSSIISLHKKEFRFEFLNWLIEEEQYINHRELKVYPQHEEEKFDQENYMLIHSAAKNFDVELFNYLVSKGHKMVFSPGISIMDPIQLMIIEAFKTNQEDRALEFLQNVKDNIKLKTLTKKRGYLHFSSFFFMNKLIKFFLKYSKVNDYYDISLPYKTLIKYKEDLYTKEERERASKWYEKGNTNYLNIEFNVTPITSLFILGHMCNSLGCPKGKEWGYIIAPNSFAEYVAEHGKRSDYPDKLRSTARYLVSKGADINIPDEEGEYILERILGMARGDFKDVINILIEETRVKLHYTLKRGRITPFTLSRIIRKIISQSQTRGMSDEIKNERIRDNIEIIASAISQHLLTKDELLIPMLKKAFELNNTKIETFIKSMQHVDKYPDFVKIIIKYPKQFGFVQYNEQSFIDEMRKNNIPSELIELAEDEGYLTQKEIDEIYRERNAIKPKKKKNKKKQPVYEERTDLSTYKGKDKIEEKYDFSNIKKMNETELEEEIEKILSQGDIVVPKQIIILLEEKGIKLPNIVNKSLIINESFARFLISKGYECKVEVFIKAVKKNKTKFVKKVLAEQDIVFDNEIAVNIKNIEIYEDMAKILKDLAIYFKREESSESEEILIDTKSTLILFDEIYLHNTIKDNFNDFVKNHQELIKKEIEKVKLAISDNSHKMGSYNYWNLRIGLSRTYYYIKNNKMYIIGFTEEKLKDRELESDLKRIGKAVNRPEDEYTKIEI